ACRVGIEAGGYADAGRAAVHAGDGRKCGGAGQAAAGDGAQGAAADDHVAADAVPGEAGAGVFAEDKADLCRLAGLERPGLGARDRQSRRAAVDRDIEGRTARAAQVAGGRGDLGVDLVIAVGEAADVDAVDAPAAVGEGGRAGGVGSRV